MNPFGATSRQGAIPAYSGIAEQGYLVQLIRASVAATAVVSRPRSIAWDRLAGCLRGHHMIVPLIWPLLDLSGAPRGFATQVEATARGYRLQSGLLLHELFRILPVLERAGCAPLVLKGPALIHTVYGDRSRHITDLDLLVDISLRERACAVLEESGYRLDADATAPPHVYARHHYHYCYKNSAGMIVELHWDLSDPMDYVRFNSDAWRGRSRTIAANGPGMRVPSDADQLLHCAKQCLDGAFADMRRIVDAAMLIRAGAADSHDFAERARECNLATPLWILLRLSREIAGVAAPALESRLRPAFPARACIASLELEQKGPALYVYRRSGLARLLRWLCAPDLATGLRELSHHFVPRGWALAMLKLDPDHPPGADFYLRLIPVRSWSFAKIVGYQGWCLARRAFRYSGPSAS